MSNDDEDRKGLHGSARREGRGEDRQKAMEGHGRISADQGAEIQEGEGAAAPTELRAAKVKSGLSVIVKFVLFATPIGAVGYGRSATF